MQVETFEQTEISAETGEAGDSAKQIALIIQLGLIGQTKLTKDDSICPYRRMTISEQKIYETIFTSKTKVEEYESGPIPLRVLQIIADAKKYPQIGILHIWHEADAAIKDPILVGHDQYKYWILARWGDALAPFEELIIRAGKIIERNYRKSIAEMEARIIEAKAWLAGKPSYEEYLTKSIPQHYNW